MYGAKVQSFLLLSFNPPPKKKVTDLLVSLRLYCRYIMHIGPIMHIRRSETNGSVTPQRD